MRKHLVIAGTGRAGTSLLVKFLAEIGLETHLSTHSEAFWDEKANAGLEDHILHDNAKLPYVVKSPWLYEYIDEVLDRDDIKIDGVIIPVRSLSEVASSRSILELQQIHQNFEPMASRKKSWSTWGTTPGGAVYSLNPLDQARLLAVGFHHLIEKLIAADIPVYLLAFPRFTHEPEYLYKALQPCLPDGVTQDAVVDAHNRVVDLKKVRVGREVDGATGPDRIVRSLESYPDLDTLDNAALKREVISLRTRKILDGKRLDSFEKDSIELKSIKAEFARKQNEVEALRQSTSWRITAPLRRIIEYIK